MLKVAGYRSRFILTENSGHRNRLEDNRASMMMVLNFQREDSTGFDFGSAFCKE